MTWLGYLLVAFMFGAVLASSDTVGRRVAGWRRRRVELRRCGGVVRPINSIRRDPVRGIHITPGQRKTIERSMRRDPSPTPRDAA